jgi:adenosylhomocysteinase
MKHGAILANAGHFDVEINKEHLAELTVSRRQARKNIEEFVFEDGKKVYLLGEGRLVNLAAGDGHPTEIMDLSFAMQVLAVLYILENHAKLEKQVYKLPGSLDRRVASLKLKAMGITIDELSPSQSEYLNKA